MLNGLLRRLQNRLQALSPEPGAATQASEHDLQLAAASLLVEMSRADFDVASIEREAVLAAVRDAFDLSEEEAGELHARAETRAEAATSLYEFTRVLNDHLAAERKAHIVELLWRVAAADARIDKYEEHLVRRIADLLHVPHVRFISAKHRVLAGVPGDSA